MAQEAVNSILQAFQNSLQMRMARDQAIQSNVEKQKEDELRQKQFDAQLEQQKVQNEATAKLFELHKAESVRQQAEADRHQAEYEAKAALQSAQTGIQAPGTTQAPAQINQQTGVGYSPVSGQGNSQAITFPSGHTLTVPTPEAYATQQAKMQEIINRPSEEAKRREKAAESEERINLEKIRQEEETKRFLKQIETAKQYDLERSSREIAGRKAIEGMMVQERIRTAMINATGGLSEMMGGGTFGKGGQGQGGVSITTGPDGQPQFKNQNLPEVISQGLTNLYLGNTSLEQLEKTNPKIKQMLSTMAGTYGVGSLTEKDRTELHDIKLMVPAAGILKELHELKLNNPTEVAIPGTDAYAKFSAAAQRLDTEIPRITKAQSGVNRQSEPELRRFFDGLVPNRNPLTSRGASEVKKYNDFVSNMMWGHANTLVDGLPENQRNAILSQHGFTKLPGIIVQKPQPAGKEVVHTRDANGRLQ